MTGRERYVVLGLAPARAGWFRSVAQWANSGSVPIEFVKCVSAAELGARLDSTRPFSAVVVDGVLGALDRDLVGSARDAGCAVFAVSDGRVQRDWYSMGVSAVLPAELSRDALLDALDRHARAIGEVDAAPSAPVDVADRSDRRGRIVAVCGAGGTGASTVAIALAQGLAADADVVLADLCLHADQAMLHDARDVVPGVQELVDAHRAGTPEAAAVRALTFEVVERQYHLLLGLRRARFWSTLRPRAFDAALGSLAAAFDIVVCDVDSDLEGEDDGGSIDVEERNVMARTAMARAAVVFAVGVPSMKGLHSLVGVVHDLVVAGVAPERIVPVLNLAPRSRRARARLAAALGELGVVAGVSSLSSPLFVPPRRLESAFRDGTPLPRAITGPLADACVAIAGAVDAPAVETLRRVRAGRVGFWTGDQAVTS